jgi:hypothetical protein
MSTAREPDVTTTSTNLISAAFERLINVVERLLRDVANGVTDSPQYDNVKELLATVPLSTDEYAIASQRLSNACRYAAEGESGAARYELTLLMRNFINRRQLSE